MGVWLVGVDTGGTFTDLIAVEQTTGELRRAKVPSVSGDPSAAVLDAMEKLFADGINPGDISLFVHGTTVATNALLEGKGVRTGLLITRGFRAVYEARGWSQPRGSDLLDTFYQKPPLLAPQWLTEEVRERLDYRGEVVTPLDEAGLRDSVHRLKAKGVEALAVCFLFSFLNPDHERRAAEIVAEIAPECRISLSSNVLPVIREYPRLSTTVIDAYVGPTIADYLMRLERRLIERGLKTPQLFLMQSNGGLMRISLGARHPNQTLLSGPAAGVIAGAELARRTRRRHVITFDMGGTSTDISVIVEGRLLETTQGQIAGQDIGTPMLRVRTLGAGGGTIAWIGKDGLLKVGPRSAGSVPGPACYGRGGEEPTVTDANVALGALSGDTVLAGSLRIDAGRAARAIETVAKPLGLDVLQGAAGILRIVNTQMAVDLRLALAGAGAGSPQVRARGLRRRGTAACGRAGPQRRDSDRARSALSRAQLRHRHAADQRAPLLSQVRGRRAQPLPDRPDERSVPRTPGAGAGGGERGGLRARSREAHPPPRSALSASRLHLAGCLSGRHHGRGQGAAQACLRRGASPGLWPVRPQGGRGDRDLPAAGGDRGPAARIARACARRRTRRARLEGRASALRYRRKSLCARDGLRSAGAHGRRHVSPGRRSSTSSTPPPCCSADRRPPSTTPPP